MKKVTLIYSKCLSDKTGASTVMRLINSCTSLFEDKGIKLNVIAREHFLGKEIICATSQNRSGKISWKNQIVHLLAAIAREIPMAAYALAYIQSMRPAKKMAKWLDGKVGKGDILFFHEMYMAYYYFKRYGKRNRTVIVTHDDGRDFKLLEDRYNHFNGSVFHMRLRKMQKFVLNNSDYIGFVSKSSASNFMQLHPELNSDIIFYSHNGLPLTDPIEHVNSRIYEIVCVGTVIESKGQCFIVDALSRMKKANKELSKIHITFVGDGPYLDVLKQRASYDKLDRIVTFVGRQNKVCDFLKKANIFILPSTSEGLPMSILEAMSMSLPIVSTPVGGIPETIIDGKTGLIIEASSDGVLYFLENIDNFDWKSMGKASYCLFKEKFSLDSMVDSYVNIFDKL